MSDIGRLFRKVGTPQQKPIENFTTEALAIAIDHDDAPIRRALAEISWPSTSRLNVNRLERVEACTQHCLFATGSLEQGYLDLVLELYFEDGGRETAWVEVKVDSPENGRQLDVYAEHALLRTPVPVIFTLSRTEVRPSHLHPQGVEIGWLSWRNLAKAIEAGSRSEQWRDFLDFLRDEQLAWAPLPVTVVEPDTFLSTLLAVNNRIREMWPARGMAWPGQNSLALRKAARAEYDGHNRIVVSGGPLTYGLMPAGDKWVWSMTVSSNNYQGVPLDPEKMVRDADRSALPDRWKRLGYRHAALQVCVPLEACSAHEDVTLWFDEALRELDQKGILADFFNELDKRRSKLASTLRDGDQLSETEG